MLAKLKEKEGIALDEYLRDTDVQWIIERGLEIGSSMILDIGNHIPDNDHPVISNHNQLGAHDIDIIQVIDVNGVDTPRCTSVGGGKQEILPLGILLDGEHIRTGDCNPTDCIFNGFTGRIHREGQIDLIPGGAVIVGIAKQGFTSANPDPVILQFDIFKGGSGIGR